MRHGNRAATAKNGDVTLTGAVRCGTERAAAEAMIADLTGVRTVTDDIQIRDDANPLHPYSDLMDRHERTSMVSYLSPQGS
jgi:BON domain